MKSNYDYWISKNLNRLNELYKLAKEKSNFYAKQYSDFTDKLSVDHFKSLPFIESNDISIYNSDFLTNDLKGSYVFTSGGSSGEPKFIYLTKEELHKNVYYHGLAYRSAGIENSDRVGSFGLPGYLTSEFTVYLGLEQCNCFIVPIGITDNPQKLYEYIKNFKINVLLVMPSDLIPVVEYIKDNKLELQIDKIITGGEPLYRSTRDFLKNNLGTFHFGSTYQSMDFGTVGYQDKDCELDEYWIRSDLQLVEILNDLNNPVSIGDVGEIIITNLTRELMPIIRYRTGDIVEVLNNDSKLGIKIKMKGRKTNIFKIGGEKFNVEIIEKYLEKSQSYTGNFQVIIETEMNKDKLKILIEVSNQINEYEEKECFLKYLSDKFIKLENMIKSKIISIDIGFVKPNILIKSDSSGKVKKVIDKRG